MGSYLRQNLDYDAINRLTTLRRDGLLLDARYYDGADRVVLSGIDGSLGKAFFDRSGLAGEQRRNVYDGAGRLYSARVLKMTDAGLSGGYATTYSGYDQAGNVTQYRMEVYDGSPYTNTYTYTHDRFEGYREKTLSGTSTALDPGQTTYQYDVNGNLIGVVDTKDASKNQTLVNDASGKILQRVQNGQTIRSLVVNGELLGTTGPAAGADDFSPSFRPIDGGNPSASPGSYRIQAGDTLQSIAQQAYGDSRLWYLVAEANGLASDRDLRVGATVTIPNRVSGNHNDYKSFKPYDPGKLIGDTQPTMPVPKPDSGGGGGCGGIGQIIVAVVAVVATVFTAGALAPAAAAAAGAAGTAGGLAGTMMTGAAILTGTATGISGMAAIGLSVAAGAIGSVVGQGVGMAIGVQSKFNWKGVAVSALGAGVTSGVGTGMGGGSFFAVNNAASAAASSTAAVGAWGMAGRAVMSSVISQGIGVATGLQSKFSWTNVAAAGIGAGVGSAVGAQVFPNASDFSERLARGFVAGAVGGVAASVLSGGKANYLQIATDAFGNALGNSVVESLANRESAIAPISNDRGRGLRVTEQNREDFAPSPFSSDDGGYAMAKFRADLQVGDVTLPQSYVRGGSSEMIAGTNYSTAEFNDALVAGATDALNVVRRSSVGMLVADSRGGSPAVLELLKDQLVKPTKMTAREEWGDIKVLPSNEGSFADSSSNSAERWTVVGSPEATENSLSTVGGQRLFSAFDRKVEMNARSVDMIRANPGGANAMQTWWNSPETQSSLNNSLSGKLINGLVGMAGDAYAGLTGYNPVSNQYYGPDEQQGAMWRAVSTALPIPMKSGATISTAPNVIRAREGVSWSEFSRLNVRDVHSGKLSPGEAGAGAELQRYLGGRLERVANVDQAVDFYFVSGANKGKTVDFMLTPNTPKEAAMINRFFEKNISDFVDTLRSHINKADIVPMDTRFLSQKNSQILNSHINSLLPSEQAKIVIFK